MSQWLFVSQRQPVTAKKTHGGTIPDVANETTVELGSLKVALQAVLEAQTDREEVRLKLPA